MPFILSLLAGLIEKIGLAWWGNHKKNEVQNAQSKDAALSDDAAIKRLHDDYTR